MAYRKVEKKTIYTISNVLGEKVRIPSYTYNQKMHTIQYLFIIQMVEVLV